jgi:hypothetical protein
MGPPYLGHQLFLRECCHLLRCNPVQWRANQSRVFSLGKRNVQDRAIARNPSCLSYKEGVAGSNPASLTVKLAGKWQYFVSSKRARERFVALLLQPYSSAVVLLLRSDVHVSIRQAEISFQDLCQHEPLAALESQLGQHLAKPPYRDLLQPYCNRARTG